MTRRSLNAVSSPCERGTAAHHASLAVSLSNEAPWSRGSRPSLGPHTSLMFPHHSPDNYRGRECHLSGASSTEDDSTRSAVQLDPSVSVLHLTPVRHAQTHTQSLLTRSDSLPHYPRWTICVLATTRALDFFSLLPTDFSWPKKKSNKRLRESKIKLFLCMWGCTTQTLVYVKLVCALPVIAETLLLC